MNLEALPTMLSMIPSVFAGVTLDDLEKIKEITRKAYPTVPQLSTETFADWLAQGEAGLLLIDVRSPTEFAVSHLQNALNLQSPRGIGEAIQEGGPSKTILYCSVGFRSTRLAHILAQGGVHNLFNLEGSIFQWANEGRALYRGGTPVKEVHPYGKRWAGLLKKGLARA